jgi:hypothetical protein
MGLVRSGLFQSFFGPITTDVMNSYYNKRTWKILFYFLYEEKMGRTTPEKGLTYYDFRTNLFPPADIYEHLDLLTQRVSLPYMEIASGPLDLKKRFVLNKKGRVLAESVWNTVNAFVKIERGESIAEKVEKHRKLLEIEKTARDIEEEEIKKIEEDYERSVGVVKTNEGAKIDLDKVEVKI